jgi:hypothetical protein
VTPELVGRLVELGILTAGDGEVPYGLGDVRRVRLADACERAGLSLDGIGEAIAAGRRPRWRAASPTWSSRCRCPTAASRSSGSATGAIFHPVPLHRAARQDRSR